MIATASSLDHKLFVWNEEGECIQTMVDTRCVFDVMTGLCYEDSTTTTDDPTVIRRL